MATRDLEQVWQKSHRYPGEWVYYQTSVEDGPDLPDIWLECKAGVWHMEVIYSGPGDFKQPLEGANTLEEAQAVALMIVRMR